jgi:hypothetical protein
MANTTWNPSDFTNITLSNGNLTANFTIGGNGGVRSIARASVGTRYWEVTATNWSGAPSSGIGIANGLATTSNGIASLINASAVLSSGDIWVNGSAAPGNPTLGARANGDIIGIALDLDNKLIWYRVAPAGSWNGSGTANPATGIGGVDIRAINPDSFFLPVYALLRGAPGGSATVVTANFGNSAFSGAVPAGFASGFSDVSPPLAIAAAGEAREILFSTTPPLSTSGMAREVLLATPTALTVSTVVREVLLLGPVAVPQQTSVSVIVS